MDIEITWDKNAIRKATEQITRNIMDEARRAATRVRCPEHGQTPTVSHRDSQTGEFTIQGCCDKAIGEATRSIDRALR